jgi:hypothetical protein
MVDASVARERVVRGRLGNGGFMRMLRRSLAVCLAVLLIAPVAQAQQHVIGKSALDRAVTARIAQQRGDREAILTLLRRAEVKDVAARTGLSIQTAEAAVATLQGDDLREIAAQARQIQSDLAGGASTVVISTTTIIIVLLLIILIVLIAD